jgi:predicted metal-dependent hydrolase
MAFNEELLEQATEFRARIIVHELLHLKVPNHGKLFKALMKSYLARGPDHGVGHFRQFRIKA